MGKPQILVLCKDFHRNNIGRARVVDKAGNVAEPVSIQAEGVSILKIKQNKRDQICLKNCEEQTKQKSKNKRKIDKIPYSVIQIEQVRVFPGVRFRIGYQFPDIFADKGTFGNFRGRPHAPAHAVGPVHLKSGRDPVLNDAIVAHRDVALAHLVAFEDHWGFLVVKSFLEAAFVVIPRFDTEIGAMTLVLGRTCVGTTTMLKEN